MRFFLKADDQTIKVELLQNMKRLYPIEILNGIRLLSKKDLGLYKLVSAVNRSTKKDIYDIDFITNDIPLITLFEELKVKSATFDKQEDKCIFDMEEHFSPIDRPELLLVFDNEQGSGKLPVHTHDNIHIVEGGKILRYQKLSGVEKCVGFTSILGKKSLAQKAFRKISLVSSHIVILYYDYISMETVLSLQ